jgi:hypothetical protein
LQTFSLQPLLKSFGSTLDHTYTQTNSINRKKSAVQDPRLGKNV